MRIGIDLTAVWRPATGMENVAIEMTKALLAFDSENRYVLFFSGEVHPAFAETAEGFELFLTPRLHEVTIKHLWQPRLVAEARLDYMHFPVFPPSWRLPCASGWTLPDATPWLYPETMKLASRWYYRMVGGRAVKNCQALVTDTESSKQDLVDSLAADPERIHVIYPGLRGGFRRIHDAEEFQGIRARYGLPEKFILFVGTLEPRKNLARILDAFRLLKTQHGFAPDLVIVGRKGWLSDPIFARIAETGLARHVHVTGYVPDRDLLALYNMARLLVFPSLYEGFGLPAIEAMACGCPVVCSNRGALEEVTNGCAVYCDPERVASIAEAVLRGETDEGLRHKLAVRGVARANSFSWRRYAEQFLEMIDLRLHKESPSLCITS